MVASATVIQVPGRPSVGAHEVVVPVEVSPAIVVHVAVAVPKKRTWTRMIPKTSQGLVDTEDVGLTEKVAVQ